MTIKILEVIVVLIFLTLAVLSFLDVFSPSYTHPSIMVRHRLVDPTLSKDKIGIISLGKDLTALDWISDVEYKAKGAFVADNKIDVKIKFTINNPIMLKEYENHKLVVIFSKAESIDKLDDQAVVKQNPLFMTQIVDKETTIEGNIRYTIPGSYGYNILILDPNDLSKKKFDIRCENGISIAPHEINTQIRSNNIMLGLGFIGIMIALLQLIISFKD